MMKYRLTVELVAWEGPLEGLHCNHCRIEDVAL